MVFGNALEELKAGKKACRSGWDGKGMFIYLVSGREVSTTDLMNEAKYHYPLSKAKPVKICSHIDMKAEDGSITIGWAPSQPDMLSEDWQVLEG